MGPNPYFGNVMMSNITLSYLPPGFDNVNTSLYGIIDYNVTGRNGTLTGYISNRSVVITRIDGTGLQVNYTFVNQTAIIPSKTYSLRSNSSVQLTFNTGYVGAIGEPGVFFFSADTNYGKAYYVIYVMSS
jgi:hypothetical protein